MTLQLSTGTIMIKPKSIFILFSTLVLFSNSSLAAVYKCTDPVTKKINFTDKPCKLGESKETIGEKKELAGEQNGKSIEQLIVEIEALDMALGRTFMYATGRRPAGSYRLAPHPGTKKLATGHMSWMRERDLACEREHSVTGLPARHNQEYLVCLLEANRERVRAFLEYPIEAQLEKSLKEALQASDSKKAVNARKVTILEKGPKGVQKGVQLGVLRLANQKHLDEWKSKSGYSRLPSRVELGRKYLVVMPIELSGGLGGSNSVVFLIPDQNLMPLGDYGHSLILSLDNGACFGSTCGMLN